MTNALQVIKTKQFDGIKLDCYAQINDTNDFWATREQIGQLLGYEFPGDSIKKIHLRNKERLNKFSTRVKLTQVEGSRTVTRDVIVYNFRGLLEICRYSNQPKANAVMDFLWEIADEIRRTGAYVPDAVLNNPEFVKSLSERMMETQKANDELREQIARDQAATTFGKVMLGLPHGMDFHKAAQILAQQGFPIGRNRLYKMAREIKWLCEQKKIKNQPTQSGIKKGVVGWQSEIIDGQYAMVVALTAKGFKQILDELTKEHRPIIYLIDREESKAKAIAEKKARAVEV